MKKILIWVSGLVAASILALALIYGPKMSAMMKITVVDIDPQVKIIQGGGNTLVLTSADKTQVLVVDTKVKKAAGSLAEYVSSLGPDVKATVINTHFHSDHTGGNALFPKALLVAGPYPADFWLKQTGSRPPDITVAVGEEKTFDLGGGELVKVFNAGRAHTENDMVVYVPSRKLLATGDLVFNRIHPFVLKDSNANIVDWVKALDVVLQKYDIRIVIPGHGPITDISGLKNMRDYFADVIAAAENPDLLPAMRKKHADYSGVPGLTGFDATLKYVQAEKKATR